MEANQSSTPSPIPSVSAPGERSGQRIMPRTSSIDSAISSLSSASQSHKSSFDATALSQADIGNLIATAGSAEAVIVHLLKEKHHAASQNSQLWRLVDKQRTLILGLNKDLERALKEKERYRKKFKELQSPAPSLPPNNGLHLQHKAIQSEDKSLGQGNPEPGKSQCQGVSAPSPNSIGRNLSSSTIRSQNVAVQDLSENLIKECSTGHKGGLNRRSGSQPRPPSVYSQQELAAASPNSLASSSSPVNDTMPGEDKQQRVPHPVRKPPPAPLNLVQGERTLLGKPDIYDSESEYEDILAVDELPVERGRRKTRDDDDREREAVLARETITLSSSRNESSHSTKAPADHLRRQAASITEQSESLTAPLSPRMTPGDHPITMAPKSPGLPVSPRPEDRPPNSPLPRLPRDMTNNMASLPIASGNGLSGLALSPHVSKHQAPFSATHSYLPIDVASRSIPSIDATVRAESTVPNTNGIYRGLVSEDYPGYLLSPNALPLVLVKVSSSRLRPSRNSYLASRPSEEEPVFTLSVTSRSENQELWRVEKVIAALPQLDQQLKQLSSYGGKLPDRSIFSGHSPAKVDARRAAINAYFEALLDTPMDEEAALVICQFLTSDAIEPRDDETSLLKGSQHVSSEILRGPDGKPRKEGYLTKRGKNFGGWKARYFVLHGPELKYLESPGGPHLGTIKIYNAQIGKQSQGTNGQNNSPPTRAEDDSDNQYRHAFLILEPKKKDSSALVRHVLCAESDEERDSWVEALLEYVEGQSENEGSNSGSSKSQASGAHLANITVNPKMPSNGNKSNRTTDSSDLEGLDLVQGFSYEDAVPAEPPVFGPPYEQQALRSPTFPQMSPTDPTDATQATNHVPDPSQLSSRIISGPTNGAVIQDAGAWGNKSATSTKEKKRSIWGFRARSSVDLASQLQASYDSPSVQPQNLTSGDRRDLVRPVFGIPLAEAVQFCAPRGVDVDLPAVVYRCIEYLKAKGAESEEGIFRLSGSNIVVKALKERFNTEGDVDFLAGDQYYDVHAVASLFKQYLRELPTTVLTRELHIEFLRVLELNERQDKIAAFNSLVHRLPRPNLALLRALVQFLIIIVNNSDVNKMTVRNVGIVFAPTLNIPAPVFSMFLTEFERIFENLLGMYSNTEDLNIDSPTSPEVSQFTPCQMLTEMPTLHTKTTFRKQGDPRDRDECMPYQSSYDQSSGNFLESNNEKHTSPPTTSRMLTPNPEASRSIKSKRRESSLLFMEVNNLRSPFPSAHDDDGE
ncbi:RhoGAPfBEM3 [Aspergillus parasiticus SU-1]|uniref:RhoGAPfBEM3 n=1 Tax=Aspergillus parasiticus (strain ATCC 56775 / NRRL 5862 / SRRC 143 / SU-1) TaxID=1403190 RepID=A0A0F0I9T5_ASPPU|nr:RhoGAPfBEM3 [Aspergillus parasiticus SU-1]